MKKYVDYNHTPANRGYEVKCLNCGRHWGHHSGWACYNGATYFTDLPKHNRYLTPDMKLCDPVFIKKMGK